jgi:hypothetical protein
VDLWTFIWLMFLLKIPIGGLLWIVWWAVHQTDDQTVGGSEDGGIKVHSHRRPLPRPPRPGRGAHAIPRPATPARVRCSMARTLAVACPVANLPARRTTSRLADSTDTGRRGDSSLNG